MKAALKTEEGTFEIAEVERPILPTPDFVLARVRVAGIWSALEKLVQF